MKCLGFRNMFNVSTKLRMNHIIIILIFLSNISFAQSNKAFLTDFMVGTELKAKNVLEKYTQFDFSKIWLKTENSSVYGIIGDAHQRIRIKLLSVRRNTENPVEYIVVGKSNVKETICDFQGTIDLTKIYEVKKMHFGVDDEFSNKRIKSQGVLIANYEFKENKEQNHSGVFKGKLYTKWYLNSRNQIEYDNIEFFSDGYFNNAFIGIWKSYVSNNKKISNWADYRVPNANKDFDIGTGEISLSEKYWKKGWLDIALKNQAPNNAIKRNIVKGKSKEWWE